MHTTRGSDLARQFWCLGASNLTTMGPVPDFILLYGMPGNSCLLAVEAGSDRMSTSLPDAACDAASLEEVVNILQLQPISLREEEVHNRDLAP